jgi:hypothetical protein
MARKSPAEKIAELGKATRAWEAHAPHDKFYALSLAEFRNVIRPSFETREQIADLNRQLGEAILRRNMADRKSMRILRGVAYAVMGDPDHGPDGMLYGAMGYVRASARRKRRRTSK